MYENKFQFIKINHLHLFQSTTIRQQAEADLLNRLGNKFNMTGYSSQTRDSKQLNSTDKEKIFNIIGRKPGAGATKGTE